MKAYHDNLKPVAIPTERKQEPESELTPFELKQLRGLLGSLQWMVTQVRFDQQFALSVLHKDQHPCEEVQGAFRLCSVLSSL